MGLKYLAAGCAAILLTLPMGQIADAQQAQDPYAAINSELALHQEILAAETNLNISGAFMHTQYHENLLPGDDENGYTGGFGVGASVLLPHLLVFPNIDLYSALSYDFSAGNLDYGGHYLASGLPVQATDHAVFNRIEGRFGLGFPLIGGLEVIPFIAAGYQSWNRNIENPGQIGTDEFYRAGLLGGGAEAGRAADPGLVVSASAEMLGADRGQCRASTMWISATASAVPARSVSGSGWTTPSTVRSTSSATANWEHFNYAGNKPTLSTYYAPCRCEYYEPLSTTTQFGVNLGVAYSF